MLGFEIFLSFVVIAERTVNSIQKGLLPSVSRTAVGCSWQIHNTPVLCSPVFPSPLFSLPTFLLSVFKFRFFFPFWFMALILGDERIL